MKFVKFLKSFAVHGLPLGAALLLVACSKPSPVEVPVRSVKVMTVGLQSMQSGQEFAGEVRARIESRLGFRVSGKLTSRLVEVGQHVKAGQLLAQLDPQDFKLGTDAARAQLAAAATNRDLAAAEFKRFKALKEQNFISGAELERREATLTAAQAMWTQAQAQLASQSNQASYTSLFADVSGVVTAVEAESGQVVSAGMPVVRMAQDGPRDVVFALPEDKLGSLKIGTGALVRLWPSANVVTGLVREVAASADPVTRTFAVKVALSAQDAPALGATASVLPQNLAQLQAPQIKLPTSAFRQEGQSSAVWVLDPVAMTVKLQPVQIATADGNEVVVANGLTPGMQVVVAGVHVLSPGQKVTIFKEIEAGSPDSKAQAAIKSVALVASSPVAK